MDFSTTTLETLESAKEFFQAMGCSAFHMSRDYPVRYAEYLKLDVPKEKQLEWIRDSVAQAAASLNSTTTKPSHLWHIHCSMEELVQSLGTVESLRQISLVSKTALVYDLSANGESHNSQGRRPWNMSQDDLYRPVGP
jgi:hypothetical protein